MPYNTEGQVASLLPYALFLVRIPSVSITEQLRPRLLVEAT